MVRRLPLAGARSWALLRPLVEAIRQLYRPKLYYKNAADKLGLSPARLSRLIRGHELPSRPMLASLAERLHENGASGVAIQAWVAAAEADLIKLDRVQHEYAKWFQVLRAPEKAVRI